MAELSDLSRRNDELMTAKDSDLVVIRDLDTQLKEYKRKYEQAKTELRSVKGMSVDILLRYNIERTIAATSQLFLQPPKVDDQLPVSPDGGLLDIHVTAFVSAIDGLLTAGRSNAPTRVLTPMKNVINAVTAVIEDVRAFERRPRRDRAEVDLEALHALRERAEATLSNLVTAAKTHATSSGMSPVSLLDAAASHVSATVTEIGRTVCIRKATKAEHDQWALSSPPPPATPTSSYSSSFRPLEDVKATHKRFGSNASMRSSHDRLAELAQSPTRPMVGRTSMGERYRPPSASTASTSSPPPIFDQSSSRSMAMTSDEGPEDAWSELKVRGAIWEGYAPY